LTEISEVRFFPEMARRSVTWDEIVKDAREANRTRHALKYRGAKRFRDRRYAAEVVPVATRSVDHAARNTNEARRAREVGGDVQPVSRRSESRVQDRGRQQESRPLRCYTRCYREFFECFVQV